MRASLLFLGSGLLLTVASAASLGCKPVERTYNNGGSGGGTASSSSSGTGGTGGSSSSGMVVPMDLYVDAFGGKDTAVGSAAEPLKTIRQALTLITPGFRIVLAGGEYSEASNGETWGYEVPDTVTIAGTMGTPTVLKSENLVGLSFKGSGDLSNLAMVGFSKAIQANAGAVHLLAVDINIPVAGTGINLEGSVKLNVEGGAITNGQTGIALGAQSELTMKDTTISSMGPNCQGGVAGIAARNSSKLTLDSVTITKVLGPAIELRSASNANLNAGTLIATSGATGCGNGEAISVIDSATLLLTGATVEGSPGPAIVGYSPVVISLENSVLKGNGMGANLLPGAQLYVNGGEISMNTGGGVAGNGIMQFTGTTFMSNGANAIEVKQGGQLKVRGSTFSGNPQAINLSTTGASEIADLGKVGDLGGNLFSSTTISVFVGWTGAKVVDAVGNTWTPSNQFTNASGVPTMAQLCGPNAGTTMTSKNVRIPGSSPCVKLL